MEPKIKKQNTKYWEELQSRVPRGLSKFAWKYKKLYTELCLKILWKWGRSVPSHREKR